MKLSYLLDFNSICSGDIKQLESLFRFAFDAYCESKSRETDVFEESFLRDDDDMYLSQVHKSGRPLFDYISQMKPGEVLNRIIPEIFTSFSKTNQDIICALKYGVNNNKKREELLPNAKLTIRRKPEEIWLLTEICHYHDFRNRQIADNVMSRYCEQFLPTYLPNIIFTKDSISSYKRLKFRV